jgi:hypothetical protein
VDAGEKPALLAEIEAAGGQVPMGARRHGVSKTLLEGGGNGGARFSLAGGIYRFI